MTAATQLFSFERFPSFLPKLQEDARKGIEQKSFEELSCLTEYLGLGSHNFDETYALATKISGPLARRFTQKILKQDLSEEALKKVCEAHRAFREQYLLQYQGHFPYESFTILEHHSTAIRRLLESLIPQMSDSLRESIESRDPALFTFGQPSNAIMKIVCEEMEKYFALLEIMDFPFEFAKTPLNGLKAVLVAILRLQLKDAPLTFKRCEIPYQDYMALSDEERETFERDFLQGRDSEIELVSTCKRLLAKCDLRLPIHLLVSVKS